MAALAKASGAIEIQVSGTCNENVLITSDDVTIAGRPGATLTAPGTDFYGAVIAVDGARRFAVRDLTVSDGAGSGINVSRGASAALERVTCTNNARYGLFVDEESGVRVAASTFSDNGRDGIGVWGNSEAYFFGAISCERNGRAGLIVSGSSLGTTASAPPAFALHDNLSYGLHLQTGASALFMNATIETTGSRIGVVVLESTLLLQGSDVSGNNYGLRVSNGRFTSGVATISGNLYTGIWADVASWVHLDSGTVSDNGEYGVYAEDSIAYFSWLQSGGNHLGGLRSRNSSLDLNDGTWLDGLSLEFGTLVEGSGNTISNVACDGTVISELDHPCDSSVLSVTAMAAGRHRAVARPRPGVEPLVAVPK
jgi:hypothetical protein